MLVVEDEALVAWLLRDVLEHHGYEVVGPASTQEGARELVQRERPEVAVVDVKLKQGDGIETAREMVREGVGVLFLTGHGSRISPRRARSRGGLRASSRSFPAPERHALLEVAFQAYTRPNNRG